MRPDFPSGPSWLLRLPVSSANKLHWVNRFQARVGRANLRRGGFNKTITIRYSGSSNLEGCTFIPAHQWAMATWVMPAVVR